ncbi:MAG: type II secretion system F family protein [Solirubrobacteraceae bacterium]
MYLYLVAAVVCMAVALAAAVSAARARRGSTMSRLATIVDYGTRTAPVASLEASEFIGRETQQPAFSGIANWLGGMFSGRLTAVGEEAIREQLMAAGMYMISPRTILGYRVLSTIALPVVAFLLTGGHGALGIMIIVLALFAGWVLPLTIVQRKARHRIDTIDRSLPDLVDLLCVTIEAGMSFPQALRMASTRFDAPLGDELRLTLQEQSMGLGIDEALAHLGERAETPAMKAFVRAMAQGEKMGISIGQIMRNLSQEMRARRRARAEEKAQKTPILMLFPLVFLIFPAMFIVLMTPAAINLVHSLKGF